MAREKCGINLNLKIGDIMKQGTLVKTIPMMTGGEERTGVVTAVFTQEHWGDEESPIKTSLVGVTVLWDDHELSYCSADEIQEAKETKA